MDPVAVLAQGCLILDPVLTGLGFQYVPGDAGKGSGGPFASGSYVRTDRRLQIHFRWSLGLVTYHFGDRTLPHEAYMWSALGPAGGNKYPGYSEDPLDGFRNLAYDLEHHATEFLAGSDDQLRRRFDDALAHPKPIGFKAITGHGAA